MNGPSLNSPALRQSAEPIAEARGQRRRRQSAHALCQAPLNLACLQKHLRLRQCFCMLQRTGGFGCAGAAWPNHSLKLSANGISRWPSSAGASPHFALAVHRAMPLAPA